MSVRVETVDGQPERLSVSWQPPAVPNGLVLQYIVYCFEISEYDAEVYGSGYLGEADNVPTPMSTFENITSNATASGNDTLTVVDGLEPYTRYACFVTAATSVGEGEPSYGSSGITAESGELVELKLHTLANLGLLLVACTNFNDKACNR